MPNIGVNYLSADRPLWFTLADCVASKLLTGKAPKVVRAMRFTAKPPQPGLRAVAIAGKPRFRVDPYKDDFYKRVIELRRRVKAELKEANVAILIARRPRPGHEPARVEDPGQRDQLRDFHRTQRRRRRDDDAPVAIFTSQGKRLVEPSKREQPGRYYHPLLATLITGAARLMLAMTERLHSSKI